MSKPVPPAVAAYTLEERQRLLDRIAQLEDRYQRDVYGLNNEGDPIGGEPAGGFANENKRLREQLETWHALDMQREADRDRLGAELDACCAALPGTIYMDPPDGGDVSVAEQLRRMGEDAARFRKLCELTEATAYSEPEHFVAEHLLQLGAEVVDDEASVFAVTLGHVLALLRMRGGAV